MENMSDERYVLKSGTIINVFKKAVFYFSADKFHFDKNCLSYFERIINTLGYKLKTADITYTESDKIKHKRINSNKGFANYDLKDLFDKKINTMTFLNENYKKHPYENDFSLHINHIQSNSIDIYLCLNLKSTEYFEIYTELYNMLSYCFDISYGAFHIDDNFRDPECLVRGIYTHDPLTQTNEYDIILPQIDKNTARNKPMRFLFCINSIRCEDISLDKKNIEIVGERNFLRKGKIISFSLIDEPELSLIELIKSEKWKALHNLLNKTGFIV